MKQLHWRLQTFTLGTQDAEARTFTMETQMQQRMQTKTVSMRNCLCLWFGLRPRLPLCLLHLINTGKFVEARANASTGCAHKKWKFPIFVLVCIYVSIKRFTVSTNCFSWEILLFKISDKVLSHYPYDKKNIQRFWSMVTILLLHKIHCRKHMLIYPLLLSLSQLSLVTHSRFPHIYKIWSVYKSSVCSA